MYRVRSEINPLEGDASANIKYLPEGAVDVVAKHLGVELLDKKKKDSVKQILRGVPVYYKKTKGTGLSLVAVLYNFLGTILKDQDMPDGFVIKNDRIIKCEYVIAPTKLTYPHTLAELKRAQDITDMHTDNFLRGFEMLGLRLFEFINISGSKLTNSANAHELDILDKDIYEGYQYSKINIRRNYLLNKELVRLDHARLNDFFKTKASDYNL